MNLLKAPKKEHLMNGNTESVQVYNFKGFSCILH